MCWPELGFNKLRYIVQYESTDAFVWLETTLQKHAIPTKDITEVPMVKVLSVPLLSCCLHEMPLLPAETAALKLGCQDSRDSYSEEVVTGPCGMNVM